jgi:Spy/CpxP family protein refolding chaperone
MKKIILLIAAVMSMTCVMANPADSCTCKKDGNRGPKHETVEERTTKMVKQLGLDNNQAAKLFALNTEYDSVLTKGPGQGRPGGPGRGGRPEGRPDGDGPQMGQGGGPGQFNPGQAPQMTDEQKAEFEAKFKEFKAKREAYDAQLKTILTDKQYTEYQALFKNKKHGKKHSQKQDSSQSQNEQVQPE